MLFREICQFVFICIKKRILADTTPVIYSIDYLPRSLFGNRDYTRIDLTGGCLLYTSYR